MSSQFKILIALNDRKLRNTIKEALQQAYAIEEATDAEQIYHHVHHSLPDLVVVDYTIPKINPLELFEGMSFLHPQTAYVLCASDDNMEVAKRVWHKRATDYIRLPLNASQLIDEIIKTVRIVEYQRNQDELLQKIEVLEKEIQKLKGE